MWLEVYLKLIFQRDHVKHEVPHLSMNNTLLCITHTYISEQKLGEESSDRKHTRGNSNSAST